MRWVGIPALALLLSCQTGKTKEGDPILIRKANYWSSMADESLPLDLTLTPDGSAGLWLRCNRDAPDRQALGQFRYAFPPADIAGVFALIATKEFSAIANPAGVVPGEVVRKITWETMDGKETFRFVGESRPGAPAFAQAENAFLSFVEKLVSFPQAALSVTTDPILPEKMRRGTEVEFGFVLSNPGHTPLRIDLPAGWKASGTEAVLIGLRTDIPLEKMSNDHSRRLSLGAGNIQNNPSFPKGDTAIVLAPGNALAYEFHVVFDWPPGPYETKFSYAFGLARAPAGKPIEDMGRFEWISKGKPFEILAN